MSSKNPKAVGVIATAGGLVVAWHGITSKKWQDAHTFFVAVGSLVALATLPK